MLSCSTATCANRASGPRACHSVAISMVLLSQAVPAGLHPTCAPVVMIQRFYRLVHEIALIRGMDPDAPPNLSKVQTILSLISMRTPSHGAIRLLARPMVACIYGMTV